MHSRLGNAKPPRGKGKVGAIANGDEGTKLGCGGSYLQTGSSRQKTGVDEAKRSFNPASEHLADLGDEDAMSRSLEECRFQQVLQLVDGLSYRRLRQAAFLRRLRDG